MTILFIVCVLLILSPLVYFTLISKPKFDLELKESSTREAVGSNHDKYQKTLDNCAKLSCLGFVLFFIVVVWKGVNVFNILSCGGC